MWISELFHFNATLHNLVFVTARKFDGSVLSLVNTDCGEIDFAFWNFALTLLFQFEGDGVKHLSIIQVSLYSCLGDLIPLKSGATNLLWYHINFENVKRFYRWLNDLGLVKTFSFLWVYRESRVMEMY